MVVNGNEKLEMRNEKLRLQLEKTLLYGCRGEGILALCILRVRTLG